MKKNLVKRSISALLIASALISSSPATTALAETEAKVPEYETAYRIRYDVSGNNTFSDVEKSYWGHDWIEEAAYLDLVSGTGNGRYEPLKELSIIEALTLVCNLDSLYSGGLRSAGAGEAWYAPVIEYADEYGIPYDYSDDLSAPVTRLQFAHMICRMNLTTANVWFSLNTPPDTTDPDVLTLYRLNIVTGMDSRGTFNGDSNLTRAEAATIISKAYYLTNVRDKILYRQINSEDLFNIVHKDVINYLVEWDDDLEAYARSEINCMPELLAALISYDNIPVGYVEVSGKVEGVLKDAGNCFGTYATCSGGELVHELQHSVTWNYNLTLTEKAAQLCGDISVCYTNNEIVEVIEGNRSDTPAGIINYFTRLYLDNAPYYVSPAEGYHKMSLNSSLVFT